MKTTLGVGLSVLSALAAQGKDFDRTELNAMLDRLAASPEPKVRRGPMAMCYKMAMPDAEEVRFTCPKCGAVTRYESRRLKNDLCRLRDAVSELKGKGLSIALDETPLCRVCTPGPKAPTAGRLKADVQDLKAGSKVRIVSMSDGGRNCTIVSADRLVGWMEASEVTNGVVAVDYAHPISRSRHEKGICPVIKALRRGTPVTILPREPTDHPDEIRVDASDWQRQYWVSVDDLDDLEYGGGETAYDDRLQNVVWVINGRRVAAHLSDIGILKTFLSGNDIYRFGHDEEMPLKKYLPRLRELLGAPKK